MYRYNIAALFEKLAEGNELVPFLSDLADFLSLCSAKPEFAEMVSNPAATVGMKHGLIDAAVEPGSSPSLFLKRLVDNGDAARLEPLLVKIFEYAERTAGIPYAEVQSAEPLDAETLERIRASLSVSTGGGSPVVSNILRKELIAGFSVRIQGKTFDFSVRGALDSMKAGLRTHP